MEEITKIKNDPQYIRLKNKQRTVQENQRFQKYLREIAALENKVGSNVVEASTRKPKKVVSKEVFVTKPNWRNQTKPVAWRNQNQDIAKNDDAHDEQYEQEYKDRLVRMQVEGKFGGLVAEKRFETYASVVARESSELISPSETPEKKPGYVPLKLEDINPSLYENNSWSEPEPKLKIELKSSPVVVARKPVKKTVKKVVTKKAAAAVKKPTTRRVSSNDDDFIKESDDSASGSFSDAEDI